MIFVTVGTHEQQFDRLVECVDKLKGDSTIKEDVIMQTGFCTFIPQYCKWQKLFSYQEMLRNMEDARIVITHGGPSSFIMALQVGKIPIVVPRKKEFGEHVNDHQVDFCRQVISRQNNIILIENVEDLKQTIMTYDTLSSAISKVIESNNIKFNKEIEILAGELFVSKI